MGCVLGQPPGRRVAVYPLVRRSPRSARCGPLRSLSTPRPATRPGRPAPPIPPATLAPPACAGPRGRPRGESGGKRCRSNFSGPMSPARFAPVRSRQAMRAGRPIDPDGVTDTRRAMMRITGCPARRSVSYGPDRRAGGGFPGPAGGRPVGSVVSGHWSVRAGNRRSVRRVAVWKDAIDGFLFVGLLQGVRDHVVADAEAGSTKFLDQGASRSDPADPLGEDHDTEGPDQRDAVRQGTSSPGQIVDDHLAVRAPQRQREHRLFPGVELPLTHGGRDRVRHCHDLPAGVMDRPDGRVGGIETRDLLKDGPRDDHLHAFGGEEVNRSDLREEDERRCVDDAPGRHAPPPPRAPRPSPGRLGPRLGQEPR